MSYNNTFVMQPAEQLQPSGGPITRPYVACTDGCSQDHVHDDSVKGKLNSAGQAIKETAHKIGDKAVELKDKAVDAVKGN